MGLFSKEEREKIEIRDKKKSYRPRYTLNLEERMIVDILYANYIQRPKRPYTTKDEISKKTKLEDSDVLLSNLENKGVIISISLEEMNKKFRKKYKKENKVYYVESYLEKSDSQDLRNFRYIDE